MKISNILKTVLISLLSLSIGIGFYKFLEKKLDLNTSKNTASINNNSSFVPDNINKGLRTPKININYQEILKDTIEEESYKDVKFYSTSDRKFSSDEIKILKTIIDALPAKLFSYRPWGIISTSIANNDINSQGDNYGVAYSGGPYIFVGDKTFNKENKSDNGTFRGLMRILAHEFTHIAQFFETYESTNNKVSLDNSLLSQKWIGDLGWFKQDGKWQLGSDNKTTDYGKTNPTEDMADVVGLLCIGDKSGLSESRIDWVQNWLETDEISLSKGTFPLFENMNQIKLEETDSEFLESFTDSKAIQQDLIKFQYTAEIEKKDFIDLYTKQLISRSWESGSIQPNGSGIFYYKNYMINLQVDDNAYPVVTIVMTVYEED